MGDPRRRVPATDTVLNEPRVTDALAHLGHERVKQAVHVVQQRAREGEIAPEHVVDTVVATLPDSPASSCRVLNATGVLLHTNLGRAPLSDAAVHALTGAAGTTDVELDLDTGGRGARGAATITALLESVPGAQAAHVVNNGASALALAATALARDREIVVARGELVEIGDGFRLPELLASTGARLREVGTTNRVHLDDYRAAVGPQTGFVLKVHPSNFVISGFTSSVPVGALSELDAPVVVDIGSGLLAPHPVLPREPDAGTTLSDGADLVTASGDKLLGGPQAGLLLGRRDLIQQLRRHPLARALRVDKLTLAALEATVRGPRSPTERALHRSREELRGRADRISRGLAAAGVAATARDSFAAVGGGGAPGIELPSAAIELPERFAKQLRTGEPPVLGHIEHNRCVLDLFALDPGDDSPLIDAVLRVAG